MSKRQMSKRQMVKSQMIEFIENSPSVRDILKLAKLSKTAKKLIPLLHNPNYLDFAIKQSEKYKEKYNKEKYNKKRVIKSDETSRHNNIESRVKQLEKQLLQTQKRKCRDDDTRIENPTNKKKRTILCGCCGKKGKRRKTCGKSPEHTCDICNVNEKKTNTIILSNYDNGGPAEESETYDSDDYNEGTDEESEIYDSDDEIENVESDDVDYRPTSMPTSDYGRINRRRKSKTKAKGRIRKNSIELNESNSE